MNGDLFRSIDKILYHEHHLHLIPSGCFKFNKIRQHHGREELTGGGEQLEDVGLFQACLVARAAFGCLVTYAVVWACPSACPHPLQPCPRGTSRSAVPCSHAAALTLLMMLLAYD